MRKIVLASLVIIAIAAGSVASNTTIQANPSKIWVINDQVLQADDGGLCGGVCDPTTAVGRAAFASNLDAVQSGSTDASGNVKVELCAPGCALPPSSGDTWVLMQTDASDTPTALNGRGLGCTPVCDNVGTQVPASDHFVVWRVVNTGAHACGNTLVLTTQEDAVTLDSIGIVIVDGCAIPTPTPDCSHPTSPPNAGCLDSDGDGIADQADNCPGVPNTYQENTDAANTAANRPGADAFGDVCDADIDGDGYTNAKETALNESPASYCPIMRADVDNDGSVSILDLASVAQSFLQSVPSTSRYKQDADDYISIIDLATMAEFFLQSVSACP